MRRLAGASVLSVRDAPATCENASAVQGGASTIAAAGCSKRGRRCG